MNEKIN